MNKRSFCILTRRNIMHFMARILQVTNADIYYNSYLNYLLQFAEVHIHVYNIRKRTLPNTCQCLPRYTRYFMHDSVTCKLRVTFFFSAGLCGDERTGMNLAVYHQKLHEARI